MKKCVVYYSKRELDLSISRSRVIRFVQEKGLDLAFEFIEKDKAYKKNLPELEKALAKCKSEKSKLIISSFNLISREILFLEQLSKSRVQFIAADNSGVSDIILPSILAFAKSEFEVISGRTKLGLKKAKENGVELGIYSKQFLSVENKLAADEFAIKMKPIIKNMLSDKIRDITKQLNDDNVSTFRGEGNRWHISSVHRLLKRIAILDSRI